MPSLKVPMEPPSEGPSNLRMVRRQVEHDCARRVLSLQPVLRPDDAVEALRHDACHAQVAGVLQQERRWLRETNRIAHLGFVPAGERRRCFSSRPSCSDCFEIASAECFREQRAALGH